MPARKILYLRNVAVALTCITCVCFFLACGFLLSIVDKQPAVAQSTSLSKNQAKQARQFVRRVSKQVISSDKTVTVHASESELNSTLALVQYSYTDVAGQITVKNGHAEFAASLKFSVFKHTPSYLNISAQLVSSADKIRWRQGRIGKLHLHDTLSNLLFRHVIKLTLGGDYGEDMLQSISDITIRHQSLTFDFTPSDALRDGFTDAITHLTDDSGKTASLPRERVQHYLDFIVNMSITQPQRKASLSIYLQKIVAEAKEQRSNYQRNAREESAAALYALAVFVAPDPFKHFVTGLKLSPLHTVQRPRLTISGREDLALHFVYSAALKILSNKDIGFSLGEMKEILDSASGGSGFSFADIAADKSGIKFADFASADESAILLQERAANSLKEADFFPLIRGLPENLDKTEFQQRYQTTRSENYQRMVAKIDTAINASALYEIENSIRQ